MMRLATMLAATALMMTTPVWAQSTKDRLARVEQQLLELQAAQPSATDAALKIQRLEQDVQTLTGRIEELTYRLDQANARLEAVSTALAGGAAPSAVAAGAPPAAGQPSRPSNATDPIGQRIAEATSPAPVQSAAVELPLDTEAAFQYASDILRAGDYTRAKEAFQLYLKSFPNSPRTADAQFRLGEIYLATGANAEAADAFLTHIRKYPNDPRTAEAHLKLGTAFSRLGRRDEACKVFKATKAKFATAPQAVLQRVDLEMQRASCK